MSGLSTIGSGLANAQRVRELFAGASAVATPDYGPTAAAMSASARQLAVVRSLQSLRSALADAQFETGTTAGDRTEVYSPRVAATAAALEPEREAITEQTPVYTTTPLTEDRDVVGVRHVFKQQPVFKTRNITETRPIYETRDVTETRDIVEARPVYTQQELRDTILTGTRTLTGFNRVSNAGIDTGADFSVTVAGGPIAVVKFVSATRISLTVSGHTTNFNFTNNNGSWRGALVGALDSVSGLDASITSNGRLRLETDNAQDLTISDVPNALFDFSASPLGNLGLSAGTTHSSVIGYQQVQTGTENVVVGTQQVVVGSQQVQTGTTDVVVGTQDVQVGQKDVFVRTADVVVGIETVTVGSRSEVSGYTTTVTGYRDVTPAAATSEAEPAPPADDLLVGFRQVDRGAAAERLAGDSSRAIRQGAVQLGHVLEDPAFADLARALDLGALNSLASTGDRDRVLARVDAALKALQPQTTSQLSLSTLLQAGVTSASALPNVATRAYRRA